MVLVLFLVQKTGSGIYFYQNQRKKIARKIFVTLSSIWKKVIESSELSTPGQSDLLLTTQ